jgi:hypothetical protein
VLVVAGGGFSPYGMTIGVFDFDPASLSSLSESESDFNCGGQSTDVGGQLSALPDPDDGGAHPAPAPKSPGVVQSAFAIAIGTKPATVESAAAASHIRTALIS